MSSIAEEVDDRISNLPETLICHILSFLPTKQAVATSVLAKRWIHQWCSVLAINFSNTELFTQEACLRFSESVYSVLLSRNSIKSFCLRITYREDGLIGFPHVVKWLNHVAQIGVETIDLLVATRFGGRPKLPISILGCKTLVVLKFQGFFVKGFSPIRLPSLKTLHFESCNFLNIRDMLLLLTGCPILEDLQVAYIVSESEDSLTNQERKSLSLSKLTRAHMATVDGVRDDVQENWVDPQCVPQCLSLNLKTCSLLRFLGLQGELLMAKYILKNARVLQTMTIRGPPPDDYIFGQVHLPHVNFQYIERELSSFPRASATCQLSVYRE